MLYKNKIFFAISLIFFLCNNTLSMFTVKKGTRPYYSLAREALYEKRQQQKEQTPLETRYQERLEQKAEALQKEEIPSVDNTQSVSVKTLIDNPKSNILYVTGSEGPLPEGLVEIPLEIAHQIENLNGIIESLGNNFESTIPISKFSSKVIQKVVNFLTKVSEQPKDLKKKTIKTLVGQMNLNEQLECLTFIYNQGLVEKTIVSTFINIALKRLALGYFDTMKNVTALDHSSPGDYLAKEIIYNPLQEVLRLLLTQKYANQRKIVVNGHSHGVFKVLCSADGTTLASQGQSQWGTFLYDTFCISDINSPNKPLIKEWFRCKLIDYHEAPIEVFDITKDGSKVLFYSYQKSSDGLLPGLYVYYRNKNNTFQAKQLSTDLGYGSARFDTSQTKIITCGRNFKGATVLKWWDVTNITNPIPHFIQLPENILLPNNYVYDQNNNLNVFPYVDFIDDTTIVVFAIDNNKFKVIFYNIQSQEKKSVELFDYTQNERIVCDINKDTHTLVVCHNKQQKMYIIDNKQYEEPIDFHSYYSIKFSSDVSKIIGMQIDQNLKTKIIDGVNRFVWPRNPNLNDSIYDIKSKTFLPELDAKVNSVHADVFRNNLLYVQNVLFPKHQNDPDTSKNKHYSPIVLKIIPQPLTQGIAKYMPFETHLSGLSGEVTSLQFSKDGNSVIGGSNGDDNNLIVWPLVTKQDKAQLEQVNKLSISTAKLLLPLSISSLQGKTTEVSLEDLNKIKIAVPQGIFNSLLIEPEKLSNKLLSRSPEILATE